MTDEQNEVLMKGSELRARFNTDGPAVFPVIHAVDTDQVLANIRCAMNYSTAGVFLINHDFGPRELLPIIAHSRDAFPDAWMGINFLGVNLDHALPDIMELEQAGCTLDGYWADDARIDERRGIDDQPEARLIAEARECWGGLYFGGTAFKKQRPVAEEHYAESARIAAQWTDVVTTSGVATGQEAGDTKMRVFREAAGEAALGLASGVTPDNVAIYSRYVDAILVATGINYHGDFYNIDPARLGALMENI